MLDSSREKPDQTDDPGLSMDKAVSRREFLKIAGVAGAAVGMGAGLGGLRRRLRRRDHHDDSRRHHDDGRRHHHHCRR